MDIYEHRRQRLLNLLDISYGGIRKRLCDASGWSEARVSQLLSPTYRDGRVFTEKNARKLESDLGLEWMYFDKGATESAQITDSFAASNLIAAMSYAEESREFVRVRKVRLRLSAGIRGFQTELDHSDGGGLMVTRKWLSAKGYNVERLVASEVHGESMEPTLHEQDIVIINTADTTPVDGGVFAVNYEGEAVIKRLSRDAGEWWLTSDNLDQRKYHRKICRGDDCIIVGRVVMKKSETF
ncbi:S24 family peptidase [Massilia pseudoviolaceinigra]|uniref:S24 family peptidase n=1 Tax=Massilia pseudoviolaceinigra TaxID=3057165 RepID=UPI002796B6F6|nr:S24 family peptidase [Massilia sp. CCM 9206]MDQ1924571.1 S24 family peptidase [Massilia sp. CCM 9206]